MSRTSKRVAIVLLLALQGCASKYALRTSQPEASLQWPFLPAPPKVSYVQTLHGFSQGGSVLKTVVYGSGGKDVNSFILPVSIAVAKDGRMAVADMGRSCVHYYVAAQKKYRKLYGDAKERMQTPVSVVFDASLRLYVADSSGRVFVFGSDGTLQRTITRAGDIALERPTGLAFSEEKQLLYVVDTLAARVFAFQPGGEPAFSFGGKGDGEGKFNFPTHIFRSPDGLLYVTDSLNFRIQTFDESGTFVRSFGRHGDGSGDFAMPKGVAVDADGVVYVVDGMFDNVQLFDTKGDFLLTLGARGTGFGEFWLPSGMTIDSAGLLYVCDTYNRRVQVFRLTEHYHAG